MRKEIHPEYQDTAVTCGCGNAFTTRSTKAKISVEICSSCHPFYTGKQKFVDAAGRIERFKKKWGGSPAQKTKDQAAKATKKAVEKTGSGPTGTFADQLPAKSKPATGPAKEAPKTPAAPKLDPAPETPKAPEAEGQS